VQPVRAAIVPAKAASKFADRIEIALEVGKRKVVGGIVQAFFARFAGRTNRKYASLDGFASIQAIVTADFEQARVIAEYGPGEGVHSREIARRMTPDSHLLLFELDAAFARDLKRQFADDPRVHVIHGDAATLPYELKRRGFAQCDYILSGIPFSILKIEKKRALLQKTHDSLIVDGSFIIYQVTNELKQHATLFEHGESEYFLQNIPPMFITVFHKTPSPRRHARRASERKRIPGLVSVGADGSA